MTEFGTEIIVGLREGRVDGGGVRRVRGWYARGLDYQKERREGFCLQD